MFKLITNSNLNYLDPGTGNFILQAIIAAGVTIGIFFKNIKMVILNFLLKLKKK